MLASFLFCRCSYTCNEKYTTTSNEQNKDTEQVQGVSRLLFLWEQSTLFIPCVLCFQKTKCPFLSTISCLPVVWFWLNYNYTFMSWNLLLCNVYCCTFKSAKYFYSKYAGGPMLIGGFTVTLLLMRMLLQSMCILSAFITFDPVGSHLYKENWKCSSNLIWFSF